MPAVAGMSLCPPKCHALPTNFILMACWIPSRVAGFSSPTQIVPPIAETDMIGRQVENRTPSREQHGTETANPDVEVTAPSPVRAVGFGADDVGQVREALLKALGAAVLGGRTACHTSQTPGRLGGSGTLVSCIWSIDRLSGCSTDKALFPGWSTPIGRASNSRGHSVGITGAQWFFALKGP